MKKLIAMLLVLAMCLAALAGCGNAKAPEATTAATTEVATEPAVGETYVYPVKDSEIRITVEEDTGRCAADGGYTAHGQYLIKDDYMICYGPCEEENGVKAIWDYVACDADLEVVGGMASAFRIAEDNTLTKVETFTLSLRGSQAIFVYDEEKPNEIMLISFYEGDAYHAVGACMKSDNILYLYGDVTGGDASWGPMLWPSVKGGYSINVPSEESEVYNTLNILTVYDVPENGSALIILNEEATECGFASVSDYGVFFATGACSVADSVLTTSGDCTNPDFGGAAQVWASCAGSYILDDENLEAAIGEGGAASENSGENASDVAKVFSSSTDANGYGINLDFFSDGTWKMVKEGNDVGFAGTWTVENGKLIFTYSSDNGDVTEEQACAEGVITIVYGSHTFTANASDVPGCEG